MKTVILFFCLLGMFTLTKAQENYDTSLIPKDLLPYASAVVRNCKETVEAKDLDNVIYHIKEAITVLNKNGDKYAYIAVYHNKSSIIKYIKGIMYNEYGKQIGKFSESDFEDVSVADGSSLFQDEKVKHYLPAVTVYPYTIAYEYEERSKQSLNIDEWEPNSYLGEAVEKSSFTFTCKPDFSIRYKETNVPPVNISTNSEKEKTYSWQLNNLKAVKDEPFSPYSSTYLSSVQIVPENFEYYGIRGRFKNWNELGKWDYDKLVANRQELPEETKTYIKELTKNITDPKLKAKKIYEYMQGKTHYVSVQVGIGGYQPFLAADVDKQNYGDCKALVNYTQALLKAVNIDSWYCVVKSGREHKVSMLNDFASMAQGDHIILCLPFKNDTTWADCTSQTLPFGYLGSFTDDRTVLACTPDGGKLIHTPKYTFEHNLKSRKANFAINNTGELSGTMNTQFKGADYEYRDELITESQTEQFKLLQKIYPINNLEIEHLELKQDKSFNPLTTENIKLRARDYASFIDGKCYFMINPIYHGNKPLRLVRNRLNNVYINRGYTDEDEITYTIPPGYNLEKEPLNITMDKPFGKFIVSTALKGNQLIYKRKFQLIDGTYSKDTYQDLVDFYQAVVDADDYNVMLVKSAKDDNAK